MPILRKEDSTKGDFAPGIERTEIVNGAFGSDSLTVADLNLEAGSQVPTHFHPKDIQQTGKPPTVERLSPNFSYLAPTFLDRPGYRVHLKLRPSKFPDALPQC